MLKSRFGHFFTFFLLLAVVLCFTSLSHAKTINLRYSDHDPPGGMRTNFVKDVFLKEIVAQTGGKVKIQDFWGGALMGSREILKGIGDGVTDMGFVYPGHYPGQLVSYSIFKLFPRGPSTFESMAWAYRKIFEEIPSFSAELKKSNQKTLMFTAGLPAAFFGKYPLNSTDDIKGQKWRSGDKWGLRFLELAGAIPTSLPWDDVYMALQTGTLDGCYSNYDGMHMKKFDEVAQNILLSKELWFGQPFIHNVNLDYWNKLPEDLQRGILKAAEIAEKKFAEVYDKAFDDITAAQKKAGYKVEVMSDADVVKWENADELVNMQEQWIKEAEAEGLKDARSVMEKMREIIQEAIEREKR